ncbi:hypothetical protein LO772_06495 [Yinghuangia sp. ASG 101]|uniref:hypothetical protein n=1 Tax=Yinghuangia sp. ASG 101 TaxID=2896848 RepID=UPI001E472222|nr:hypothetical protein [Yinghuangia sp. ASG 101]UGQ13262.1 hypothetical protein LO772_06495 [Yinghuangia sp. ASG 101]
MLGLIAGLVVVFVRGDDGGDKRRDAFDAAMDNLAAAPALHTRGDFAGARIDMRVAATGDAFGTVTTGSMPVDMMTIGDHTYTRVHVDALNLPSGDMGSAVREHVPYDRWMVSDSVITGVATNSYRPRAMSDMLRAQLAIAPDSALRDAPEPVDGVEAFVADTAWGQVYVSAKEPYRVLRTTSSLPGVATGRPPSVPSGLPTELPTELPTQLPTDLPTDLPTNLPTGLPTGFPTGLLTGLPGGFPTDFPTAFPTARGKPAQGLPAHGLPAHPAAPVADTPQAAPNAPAPPPPAPAPPPPAASGQQCSCMSLTPLQAEQTRALGRELEGKVAELANAIDPSISYTAQGQASFSGCGPGACTVTATVTGRFQGKYVTNPQVTADMTVTMTFDGAAVGGCSATGPLPVNGPGTMSCVNVSPAWTAAYSRAQANDRAMASSGRQPPPHIYAAQVSVTARAMADADVEAMKQELQRRIEELLRSLPQQAGGGNAPPLSPPPPPGQGGLPDAPEPSGRGEGGGSAAPSPVASPPPGASKEEYEAWVDYEMYRINTDPEYFKQAYRKNGYRQSGVVDMPPITWDYDANQWIPTSRVPPPLPPKYVDEPITRGGRETARSLDVLDAAALRRRNAIDADILAGEALTAAKQAYAEDPSEANRVALDAAEADYKPKHTEMGSASEDFGELVAELQVVPEHYAGYSKETLLGPANGNDQFDQVWKGPDGRYVVIEAKSSLDTALGARNTANGPRASQGTWEYFDDILTKMRDRGEVGLVNALLDALTHDKLDYIEVHGNPQGDTYGGYTMQRFDISDGAS